MLIRHKGAFSVKEKHRLTQQPRSKPDLMKWVAAAIVKYRYVFFILFLLACLYCVLSMDRVQVNSDITAFLPEETETHRGLTVMEEESVTYATASVRISNTTYEKAKALAEQIEGLSQVTEVAFDDSSAHFVDSAAMLSISFDGESSNPAVAADMETIRSMAEGLDAYIST